MSSRTKDPDDQAPRRRGRPPLGDAPMTATERWQRKRDAQIAAGGRRVNAFLSPEAAQALDKMTASGASVAAVINAALIAAAAALAASTRQSRRK